MPPSPAAASRRRRASLARLAHLALAALALLGFLAARRGRGAPPVAAAAVAEPATGGVIKLDAKNFDSSLRDGKVWLIEFYAPWCGHCVRFAATYETVATQLHAKQKTDPKRQVNVAKVDGAAERALASRFGVNAFPTFFLVDGWTVREFAGTRSQEGLVKFAESEYKETEPVPFLFGPFGPTGQLKGWMMWIGTWAIGLYENLTVVRGYRPLVAMAILCVGGLATGLALIILAGVLFLPKAKQD